MTPRFNTQKAWPPGYEAMHALSAAVDESGLDLILLNLVFTRASQLNGCAYCLDMHSKDARALGETEQRLHLVAAWREAPAFFDERERGALALTEAVTLIATAPHGELEAALDAATEQFKGDELPKLMFAITAINSWNRLAIAAGSPVGHYQSPHG